MTAISRRSSLFGFTNVPEWFREALGRYLEGHAKASRSWLQDLESFEDFEEACRSHAPSGSLSIHGCTVEWSEGKFLILT